VLRYVLRVLLAVVVLPSVAGPVVAAAEGSAEPDVLRTALAVASSGTALATPMYTVLKSGSPGTFALNAIGTAWQPAWKGNIISYGEIAGRSLASDNSEEGRGGKRVETRQ
jgi:hypothetical protein